MRSSQLTVLIPCKNESSQILNCLRSAARVADEILVADSGSTDCTLELVRAFKPVGCSCRLVERHYVNSGNFKNWGIPQATGEWVFVLDADERITPDLADSIRAIVRTNQPDRDGYWVRRQNFFFGRPIRYGDWGGDQVLRLFRRDVGRYREHTDHAEIDIPPQRVGHLSGRLEHYSFTDYSQYMVKMRHYAHQQALLWHQVGRRPSHWNLVVNGLGRFLRGYVLRGGFLDGAAGFQLAVHTAYYSFLKQSELWAMYHYPAGSKSDQQTETAKADRAARRVA